jgi:uncharacterized protein (TIGR01777 family)
MIPKEKVLIAGGTGLIGNALIPKLEKAGYEAWTLSRKVSEDPTSKLLHWDPYKNKIDPAICNFDYIINLVGAGIVDHAWTDNYRKTIIESRKIPNEFLAKYLSDKKHKIKKVLSVSAIGYYGEQGNTLLSEDSSSGEKGFLPEVCKIWEDSAKSFTNQGIETNIVRIGIVLSTEGGFLKKLEMTKPLRILNILGSGNQYVSWIHMDDLSNIFIHLLAHQGNQKVYNAVAPEPVTLKTIIQHLKSIWGGPYIIQKVPAFAISLLFGERKEAILADQKVISKYLKEPNFKFKYKDIGSALSSFY